MKTLVIVAHPHMEQSRVNQRWVSELAKYPDKFTVHQLYQAYPDGHIDVEREQALVESHGSLVLQFPLYWFNCTPLMKKWLDEVLTYGWAFGSTGDRLRNRRTALAVTAGVSEDDYSPAGKYKYTLEQILLPFEMTFNYINADYRGYTAFYDAEYKSTDERIEGSVSGYIDFLSNL
ncbi:NAD(P)H-dependent oxidoreductase [Paenibacillus wulumuqiensis]|uniref:NAD(P)H-dependent oxidoreductase n=1 Tax=Paenibacillus wulumuqiensis TaxID=1567107 RepID=UPI000619359D|nr:NAD(P)H-dependent oxidoreductase [Paenibacillus wulumuqiensis]